MTQPAANSKGMYIEQGRKGLSTDLEKYLKQRVYLANILHLFYESILFLYDISYFNRKVL